MNESYANGTATQDWSLEACEEAMREFDKKVKDLPPRIDVIVCTQDQYEMFMGAARNHQPVNGEPRHSIPFDEAFGIPIEVVDEDEINRRVFVDHVAKGENAAFMRDGELIVVDAAKFNKTMELQMSHFNSVNPVFANRTRASFRHLFF